MDNSIAFISLSLPQNEIEYLAGLTYWNLTWFEVVPWNSNKIILWNNNLGTESTFGNLQDLLSSHVYLDSILLNSVAFMYQ